MNRQVIFVVLLSLLTAVGLALRLPALGNRPMHADEAVHAVKFRDLREQGVYRYDPNEFHGPTLYYAALPAVAGRRDFADTCEGDYRLPVALIGAAMILLLALLADGLGRPAALVAGTLIALSPAFVFYSRYFIQEALLAFFTLGALAYGWRYTRNPTPAWAAGIGVFAGLMIATKETAVLAFAAAAFALGMIALLPRNVGEDAPTLRLEWNAKHAALALSLALLTASLLLTGMFSNPPAVVDYLRSFTPWIDRAHATDMHRQPWVYYLEMLAWSHPQKNGPVFTEAFLLGLAAGGALVAFSRRATQAVGAHRALLRFVTIYTLALVVIYSAIPYKTPWCVLTFLTGVALLAGVGAALLWQGARGRAARAAAALLMITGLAHLGWQAYSASFVYFADNRNPYVYAQTLPEAVTLSERVRNLARAHPDGDRLVVKVFSADGYYWPLPWYLRRFPNVGYWAGQLPADANAPVVIASPKFDEELTRRLDATHLMTGFYGLRPGSPVQLWVRMDLWARFLETRKTMEGG